MLVQPTSRLGEVLAQADVADWRWTIPFITARARIDGSPAPAALECLPGDRAHRLDSAAATTSFCRRAPFHVQLLGTAAEPSTITDFKGIVGGVDLLGTGVGTNTKTGVKTHLFTAIDNRFMQGVST